MYSKCTNIKHKLSEYIKVKSVTCRMCKGIKHSTRQLGPHLFIDTDIDNLSIKLDEIIIVLCE